MTKAEPDTMAEPPSRNPTEPLFGETSPQESSYLGQTIDGRYLIKKLVGRGGMGTVYEVEQIHLKKIMAMKLLHEDLVIRKQLIARFTREARAVSRLENPHTVRVFDFGRSDALFYLVMEFLDGEDVEVLLSREGALPWRRALLILDQVCQSLDEAHAVGIVHRDLKPENIMLLRLPVGADYVKVLDFGLAKIQNSDDVFSVHSNRDLFGTPFYMAPEQIRSEEVDPRADIYALGCLCYRMLTNQHVYDAASTFDVLRQHLTAPIPSVCRARPRGQIPARVDRMIFRALAKKAENRFPSAAALREEIRGCIIDPEGQSFALPVVQDPDGPEEIDSDLAARLRAFDDSAVDAEGRMAGEAPPELPPPELNVRRSGARAVERPVEQGLSDILILDPTSDEARYARNVRRDRKLRNISLLLGATAIAVVGVAAMFWRHSQGEPGRESEPNDSLKKANSLESGAVMEGALGKRLSTFESDRDVYRLRVGHGTRYVDLDLSAVADLDLAVDVATTDGDLITTIDGDGIGLPESLHRFLPQREELVLTVREAKSGDAEPTEKPGLPYHLTATVYDALPSVGELEVNGTAATATPLERGVTAAGWLDGPRDVDVYRVDVPPGATAHRWEIAVESEAALISRITLSRLDGEAPLYLYSDEGRTGVLRTVFEEEKASRGAYFVAVSHSGRGEHRGQYRLTVDLRDGKPRIASEPDDDRQRATQVAIGESVSGQLEQLGDVDVFAVQVSDPQRRGIEVAMAPELLGKLRVQISDVNKLTVREFPTAPRPGEPPNAASGVMRFEGQGEVYYITVAAQGEATSALPYSFRVQRSAGDAIPGIPGGPFTP